MPSNLDRYKNDLSQLISNGEKLLWALQRECFPKHFHEAAKEKLGDASETFVSSIPKFRDGYQHWYSEAKVLIKQLLPDRLEDFVRYYERPRSRKAITSENYKVEDYLNSSMVSRELPKEFLVGMDAAIPQFTQQLAILKSAEKRFESTLFEIRQLLQADLLDSELAVGKELVKKKFTRAAGAIAGVVLERHLKQVCATHKLTIKSKTPRLAILNQTIKDADVIDIPQWRFIQHLTDVRNLCDHSTGTEPTVEQVAGLIEGVSKVIKTVH